MRSLEEIQQDMGFLSTQAGDLQYRAKAYLSQLDQVNDKLAKIHQEMADFHAVQAEVKDQEATNGEG